MRTRTTAFAAMIVLAACGGGGDSTGPAADNMDGDWKGSVTNLVGSGLTCSATGVTLSLSESSGSFGGTYYVTKFSCSSSSGSASSGPAQGSIVNGSHVGTDVSFDMDTPDFHFTGTHSANVRSMSGSTTWTVDVGPPTGTVTLNGSWSVSRQ